MENQYLSKSILNKYDFFLNSYSLSYLFNSTVHTTRNWHS